MHRNQFLQKLQRYAAVNPAEEETGRRFIQFVEEYPDCFVRELAIAHVTGSAWVVDEHGEMVILTHHKKLNKWIQLGGHCDGNPNVLQVARREAQEESGIRTIEIISVEIFDIDVHLIPQHRGIAAHYHFDTRFAFRAAAGESLKISDESHDLAWVEIGKMAEFNGDESMMRLVRKWLKLQSSV